MGKLNERDIDRMPKSMKRVIFATSLTRVFTHFKNGSFAFVSGWRPQFSADENMSRNEQLASHARDMGYGYSYVMGKWGNVPERTVFIPAITKEDANTLSAEFEQDAFVWGEKGEYFIYETGSFNVIDSGSGWHTLREDEEQDNFTALPSDSRSENRRFRFVSEPTPKAASRKKGSK
jgi:hypothetical protein